MDETREKEVKYLGAIKVIEDIWWVGLIVYGWFGLVCLAMILKLFGY